MNLKITQKTEEPLLSRTRIEGTVDFDQATPSSSEIQATISKSVGKDAKLVAIEKIQTEFGLKHATVLAFVYDSEDMIVKAKKEGKKQIEKKKKAEEEAKKKAEEAKAAKEEAKAAEEAPKEEKSEEKKEPEAKEEQKAEEKKEELAKEEKSEEKKDEKPEEKKE